MAANAMGSSVVDAIAKSLPPDAPPSQAKQAPIKQNITSHDELEDTIAFMPLPDPTLPIAPPHSDDITYELSELNRKRMERWNAAPTKTWAQQKQMPQSNRLIDLANSSVVSNIIKVGDSLANSSVVEAINEINPIIVGGEILNKSETLYQQGNILNAAAGAGLAVLSSVPGEAFAMRGIAGAEYLSSRYGFFGAGGRVLENNSAMQATTKHPLSGLSVENVVRLVDEIGLETPRDELILWSGLGRGDEGVRLSQEYARDNGGITLEMTSGGKWLHEMNLLGVNSPFTFKEAVQIWEGVSTKLTQQASGQVRSIIGQVRPISIYRSEQSEILMNRRITGLDELYLKPRFIFGRN